MGFGVAMITRLQLYILLALAFVAGVFGVYVSGVQRGIDKARNKINEDRLDKILTAKEIEDEIRKADDPYLVDRARTWVRKDSE